MARFSLLPLLALTPLVLCAAEPHGPFLYKYCRSCHTGKNATGGFAVEQVSSDDSFSTRTLKWQHVISRVRNMEMPPKGAPAPSTDLREAFLEDAEDRLHAAVCSTGAVPVPTPMRRLNRDEYAASVRDLLNVTIDVSQTLPVDGAGGEGFDNAGETLSLSPLHAEKYLEAAKLALNFASTDARARALIFPKGIGTGEAAARKILQAFVPRAFRRPAAPAEIEAPLDLYRKALATGENFERSVLFALQTVLISPHFLFRVEPPNPSPDPRLLDNYSLAARLSYFLWGSIPDEMLTDIAAEGRLQDPAVLKSELRRLLRNPKSMEFTRRFVEQWLRTRELTRDKGPDPVLFPIWAENEEVRSDIQHQPVLFFREMVTKDKSVLDLLDSDWTIMNRTLARMYDLPVQWRKDAAQALYAVRLPEGSDRGGLLGMPAVLALSSYPNRTSPVLRGAWVLDAILGTPPPPPPPGVPPLDEGKAAHPVSMRERLSQHRSNPVCASCHSRIDPMGFALENYDVLGFWRAHESGRPIDVSGELPDGSRFDGPREMKKVLLAKKDVFVRNLAGRMLGYALGRGLTLRDSCAVDEIVAHVKAQNYSAQALVEAIVFSPSFRYQAGAAARPAEPAAASESGSARK